MRQLLWTTSFFVFAACLPIAACGQFQEPSRIVLKRAPAHPEKESGEREIEYVHTFDLTDEVFEEIEELSRTDSLSSAIVLMTCSDRQDLEQLIKARKVLAPAAGLQVVINLEQDLKDLDDLLEQLCQLQNLTTLDFISTEKISLTDNGLKSIAGLPSLQKLTVPPHVMLTEEGYRSVGTMTRLTDLYLFDTNLSSKSIGHLTDLPLLRLYVVDVPLTDDVWGELAKCSDIEEIFLSGTNVTGKGIQALRRLLHLSSLTVSRTPFTDSGVWELRKLKRLDRVNLTGCLELGEKSAGILSRFDHLTQLDISNSSLSDDACQRISKSLENTIVKCE